MISELSELAAVSRRLGANAGYVQGGGGNTSIKIDGGDVMYIKASGIDLATISAETGFLPLNSARLKSEIGACKSEADYSALMAACLLRERMVDDCGNHLPSIESGFHALLGRCVLHSHSVWANLLTCAQEGRALLAKALPDALWVDYCTPGLTLTLAIAERIQDTKASVIFLQNHGLIVSAETPDAAYALHSAVNQRVRGLFASVPTFPRPTQDAFQDEGLLFPDQAVYQCNPALAASLAGQQTAQAYAYLLGTIPELGLTLNFINDAEKAVLLNMESEKHRQKVAQA